ncbi:hypothetical protein C9J60_05035 [Streptomyces sp. A244]|uniref:hypothetical protein n=1 Tax=Streptomyces sp. A244 TaxID=2137016 RepID=UPI000D1B0A2C|nr:hypothetical protein [Streptomyces sp. A244]PTH90325.1 hypothetical protein C9J60_05035 [Streptomyces sp. A244]
MDLSNLRIETSVAGATWTFKVHYSALFTTQEINAGFLFADTAKIMEDDDVDDDLVHNWAPQDFYRPSQTRHDFVWTFRVHEDAVDTELGGEEIYGKVALRNVTTSSGWIMKDTGILQVSPG